MAFLTETAATPVQSGIFSKIGVGFLAFFAKVIEARDRGPQIRHLESLSDKDLAKLGIYNRQDIVRYVFRDVCSV